MLEEVLGARDLAYGLRPRFKGDTEGPAAFMRALIEGVHRKLEPHVKPVLWTEDLAVWFGVTPRAIRDSMERGEIPWTWQGRRRVVVREQLVALLAKRAEQNVAPEWRP